MNFFAYVIANPLFTIDTNGLMAKGTWVTQPTIASFDVRLLGFRRLDNIYFDVFGFINFFSLDFHMSAVITAEVQCTTECPRDGVQNPGQARMA